MTIEGKPHYAMMTFNEIEALYKFAQDNLKKDHRTIVITKPNGIGSTVHVMDPTAFFACGVTTGGLKLFGEYKFTSGESLITEIPKDATDITDYNSW